MLNGFIGTEVYIAYKSGPKTDPWDTARTTFNASEQRIPILTDCTLSVKYNAVQAEVIHECRTSNALEKPSKLKILKLLELKSNKILSTTSNKAVSQL